MNLWNELKPREWQKNALQTILDDYLSPRTERAGIIRATTGAGKSVVIRAFISYLREHDTKVLVVVPSISLVKQITKTLKSVDRVGQVYTKRKEEYDITVTTLKSLPLIRGEYGVVIIDECHKSETLRTKKEILRLKGADTYVIGFTATPYRADAKESLTLFDRVLVSYGPTEAIADGVCVPTRILTPPDEVKDLDDAIVWAVRDAQKRVIGAKILVSTTSIKEADRIAALLMDQEDITAWAIHSGPSTAVEPSRAIEFIRDNDSVGVHVSMLVEGVDLPWLNVLITARKTNSDVRIVQEVGRIVRSHPWKREAVWYDLHGVSLTHNLGTDPALWKEVSAVVIEDTDEVKEAALALGATSIKHMSSLQEVVESFDPFDIFIVSSLKDINADAEDITFLKQRHPVMRVRLLHSPDRLQVIVGSKEHFKSMIQEAEARGWKPAWCQEDIEGLDLDETIIIVLEMWDADHFREMGWLTRCLNQKQPKPKPYKKPREAIAWVTSQRMWLEQIGEIIPPKRRLNAYGRGLSPTVKQRGYLQGLFVEARFNPPPPDVIEPLRAAAALVLRRDREATMGTVADLITLMKYYTKAQNKD